MKKLELTGKAKKDFEKWYNKISALELGLDLAFFTTYIECTRLELFYGLTNSMRFGVYVDFFRMNNISVFITDGEYNLEYRNTPVIHEKLIRWQLEPQKSIKKARVGAITKANEIYNETRSWKQ